MVTEENVEANTAALDVAADDIVVVPGAADESTPGTPTATLNVAVETTATAPSTAKEDADAANTALD
eukprot:3308686-Pleurochrysis_carterae.AAC.1